jgi:hypothetical protein
MADLFLSWPLFGDATTGDLQVGPDGDLLTVDGYDETRQNLTRLFLTNPRQPDPNNSNAMLPADDTFHTSFGLGLRRIIGKKLTGPAIRTLTQLILGGMRAVAGVAQQPPPNVVITPQSGGGVISGTFTQAGTNKLRAIPSTDLTSPQ